MWDEYGQRHQYLCTVPTLLCLMPLYWYGSFANRNIEQNYAAKMYQLDYEQRRNRLTHNMIMEHFEMHVEKAMDIMDQIKEHGFEKAFEYEINHPPEMLSVEHPKGPVNNELKAEFAEESGDTSRYDSIKEHFDLPFWLRKELDGYVQKRATPHGPYKYLPNANYEVHRWSPLDHYYVDPFEKLPEPQSDS
jgi:hypothetical protein